MKRRTHLRLAFLYILFAGFSTAAIAGAEPESRENVTSAKLVVSRAEISTAVGRHDVEARVQAIARRLCRNFRDTRSIADREAYAECTADAYDGALRQLVPAGPVTAGAAPPASKSAQAAIQAYASRAD
jgi:UrcA family protein